MSRIGMKPVRIPESATVTVDGSFVRVSGPKGSLSLSVRPELAVKLDGHNLLVERTLETPKAKSLHGLTRSLVANMITGVEKGWNKGLEMVGVGYRPEVQGNDLVLNVGFSHPVRFPAPEGITFSVFDNTKINVTGVDKQLVGEVAAQIRKVRPPEPYKGKGIRYIGETIRRKAGKAAKTMGTTGAK